MTEPPPIYTGDSGTSLYSATDPTLETLQNQSVYGNIGPELLENFERRLTALLVEVWKLQGKRRKIITLE